VITGEWVEGSYDVPILFCWRVVLSKKVVVVAFVGMVGWWLGAEVIL